MNKISVVFFGTHRFATVILQGLIDSPFVDVALVVTRPDKPVGRKKLLESPPVKILADTHGIMVIQPTSLKHIDLTEFISQGTVDVGVTAQYGLLIPKHVLDFPTHGILNVHTSLLPKYRGASPIQSALINGDTQTGVTIMKMGIGLDTGPILLQGTMDIAPDDTYLDLDENMAPLGSQLLLEALPPYIDHTLIPQEQDDDEVTECRQFTREDGLVDWKKSAQAIYNQYRGMTPWPGIYTQWEKKRLKLLQVHPVPMSIATGVVEQRDDQLLIGCGNDSLQILELQLEGKQAMDALSFCRGFRTFIGAQLQ